MSLVKTAYNQITKYGNATSVKLLRSNRTKNLATRDYDGTDTEIPLYAYVNGIVLDRAAGTTIKQEGAKILARVDGNFDGVINASDRISVYGNEFKVRSKPYFVGDKIAYVEMLVDG